MPLLAAKVHYDKAASEYPERYAKYSFEQWMAFLKAYTLLIHHPSDMLEITIIGKDFLKYSTHNGRFPDGREF
jgi:hypothetical protein